MLYRRPVDVEDEEEVTGGEREVGNSGNDEPIIELPESPSPPPEANDSDDEQETAVQDSRAEEQGPSRVVDGESGHGSDNQHRNPLGVQPRKPIRTHQDSPLATMSHSNRPGHSMKRFAEQLTD